MEVQVLQVSLIIGGAKFWWRKGTVFTYGCCPFIRRVPSVHNTQGCFKVIHLCYHRAAMSGYIGMIQIPV